MSTQPESTSDTEQLAEEAKLERQTKCSIVVNKVLEEYKCQVTLFGQINNTAIPLNQLIQFPVILNIVSK